MEVSALPDDVLIEILVRVDDPPSLFRCATACKRWRHLVSDPSFLRRRWPDRDYSSSLVGFLAWQHCHCDCHEEAALQPCFVPTPRSPLAPGLRALGSFVTAAPAGLFDGAVPLVSRHGLLLVRLEAQDQHVFQLAVCSLLMGSCHMLPPLNFAAAVTDFDDYEYIGYALVTRADCGRSSPPVAASSFFKVAIVTSAYCEDLKYSLHMVSSDESRWSVRTNCFGNNSPMEDYGTFGDVVLCHGTAHWLFHDCGRDPCFYVIKLDTQSGHISRMKLRFLKDYSLASRISLALAANGTLSVLWMQETAGNQLEIWGQHQEDQQNVDSEWQCTRMIEKKRIGEETTQGEGRKLWVLGEKCGTFLVKDRQGMYTADLKTGRMEEVSNWPPKPFISLLNVLLLEIDWPTIFISRLCATLI